MATVAELSVEEEIKPLKQIADCKNWVIKRLDIPGFVLGLQARDQSQFWVRCHCDGYPAIPPAWHWFNPESDEVDQLKDTPIGGQFFHSAGVICAPWNRLAYKSEDPRGPHNDWSIGNWRINPYTRACKNLAAMALRIAVELQAPTFGGRKGQINA